MLNENKEGRNAAENAVSDVENLQENEKVGSKMGKYKALYIRAKQFEGNYAYLAVYLRLIHKTQGRERMFMIPQTKRRNDI